MTDDVRFEVFCCEPLVMARLRRARSWQVALGAVGSVAVIMLVANAFQETVAHPGLEVLRSDVRALFRGSPRLTGPDFPLLRDYASVAQAFCWALSLAVLHRQWVLIEALVPSLRRSGIFVVQDPAEFDAAIQSANEAAIRWAGRRQVLARLAVGAGLAAAFVVVPRLSGVFATLAPEASRAEWADDAYRNWWARLQLPGFGFAAYYLLLAYGLYVVVTLNVVGIRVMGVFLERRDRIGWRLNRVNPDGYFGWDVPRRILWTIYLSVLLHMAILSLVFVMIPREGVAWVLIVILTVVLISYPVYLVVPLLWLSASLRRHKVEVAAALAAEAPGDPGSDRATVDEATRQRKIRAEVEAVRALPSLPFRRRQIAGGLALLATVVGLIQLGADLFV